MNRTKGICHAERALYRSALHSYIIIRILCIDVMAHNLPQHADADEHSVFNVVDMIHGVNEHYLRFSIYLRLIQNEVLPSP
jgi:hypothetical protein